MSWLPTSVKEMQSLGWDQADVILVSGDAYIDHPSFGIAVLARLLEGMGLKVAVLPQPNWQDDLRDFRKLGAPKLYFGVSSGSMDSMINNYTGNKRKRSDDAYSPGGKAGHRPDNATTVYSGILKKLYPETPVIIGGIESSLRRLVHYDYWSDSLKPSILIDTNADLLVYGMGEKPLMEITAQMIAGKEIQELRSIPQTAFLCAPDQVPDFNAATHMLASYEECLKEKKTFAQTFKTIEEESNKLNSARLVQKHGKKVVVINPPYTAYSQEEIDLPYNLSYNRKPHPRYSQKDNIPAWEMIRYSVNIHRGCFGGCSFCTISAHQGKFVQSRSEESIIKEVKEIANQPDFKGHLSDLGGPSANMYRMKGLNPDICSKCSRYSCIYPKVCKNMNTDHTPLMQLYQKVSAIPGIKKVTIGSGIRYDLFLQNPFPNPSHKKYLAEVMMKHVSGRLKVAPEHTEEHVLRLMRKPSFKLFEQLKIQFDQINQKHNLKQQLIPYLISAHPGTRNQDMINLAIKTREMAFHLEQVQEFTPTPMTLSSVIYYTGIDPYTMEPVYVPIKKEDRQLQRKFFFWYKPENIGELKSYLLRNGLKAQAGRLFGKKQF
jgi:uncharacterized radical SAM protein YgiQ